MKFKPLFFRNLLYLLLIFFLSCNNSGLKHAGYSEITKWKGGKSSAVSLTYDGGTINQFQVALPIMDRLGFPATFFIVTGEVEGSQFERRFIGRPLEEIVMVTEEVTTNEENFFERASAIRVLGDEAIIEYHTRAGDLWETGKFEEAYRQIDEAYALVRSESGQEGIHNNQQKTGVTWDELKVYAAQGHEFASHSVSHAQFGILDDANLVYELEKSREEILNHLGPKHIFSVECPYGTENERVMDFSFARFEASRNRMPEPFLEEINRWNKMAPGSSMKEYVQWQRGPKSDTPLEQMTSWIDTCTANDNVWLVLVFHGIEGIGWEAIRGDAMRSYFEYIKSKEGDIWVGTFQDVTKYIRERMNAEISFEMKGNKIRVNLTHTLDPDLYDLPLTLKTYVPNDWESITVNQGSKSWSTIIESDDYGHFVQYESLPNAEDIVLANE
jgi:peptidoglycan/xylan/chitin deacetylase (PgdA/CDA1 family)